MTQSAPITATYLDLSGSGASYILTNSSNNITYLAAGVGTGNVNLNNGGNNLSISTVNFVTGVTAATLQLTDTATVGQTAWITVTNLDLLGSGATYTLNNPSNSVGTVAANVGTTGSINLVGGGPNSTLSIGTVNSVSGVTAGTLTLFSNGTVTQTTALAVANLELLGEGATYTLTNSSNNVSTLAANVGTLGVTTWIGQPDRRQCVDHRKAGGTTGVNLSGTLTLNVTGSISDPTAAVTVNAFILNGGNWSQIGTLPTFTATNDFELDNGATFLRAANTITTNIGSLSNPYQLTDIYGVQGIAGFLTKDFVLNNTINATGTATWNGGAGFVPIGTDNGANTYFTGIFNGQNFVINNLTINQPNGESITVRGINWHARKCRPDQRRHHRQFRCRRTGG